MKILVNKDNNIFTSSIYAHELFYHRYLDVGCDIIPTSLHLLLCALHKNVIFHSDQLSLPSSAYFSPLLDIGLALNLSHIFIASVLSQNVTPSRLGLPSRGLHSRTRFPNRLSVLEQTWPAHCHLGCLFYYVDDPGFLSNNLIRLYLVHERKSEHIP